MVLKKMLVLLVSVAFQLTWGNMAIAATEAQTTVVGSGNGLDQPRKQESGAKKEEVPEEEEESKSEERRPHLLEIKEEIKEKKEFEIHGGLVGFYQGSTTGRIEGENVETRNGFGMTADLQMTYRPPVSIFKNGKFFVRVHAGSGRGADNNVGENLFANLNTIADNSDVLQTDFDSAFWLAEAYYAHEFWDGRLILVAGKTEPVVFIDNNAFANNPISQFVGKPFVNNPMFNSEDQLAPIVAASFAPIETISVTALGVSSSHPNVPFAADRKSIYSRLFDQPLVAFQLAYAPKFGELQGNYRIYYWNATYHHENSAGAASPDGSGVGISCDQMVTEKLGLFARVAYSSEDAFDSDWFWSAGVNLKGLIPSREKDELGIGIAGLKGTLGPDNLGTELHAEIYYRIVLTEYLAVSPDIQYVADPLGNAHNDGVFAGMVRVEFSF